MQARLDLTLDLAFAALMLIVGFLSLLFPDHLRHDLELLYAKLKPSKPADEATIIKTARLAGALALLVGLSFFWHAWQGARF